MEPEPFPPQEKGRHKLQSKASRPFPKVMTQKWTDLHWKREDHGDDVA